MRSFKRFAKLPTADQLLVLQALLLIAAMWIALRMLPFRVVRRHTVTERQQSDANHPVSHIIWAVAAASRYFAAATCLPQALAAHVLLARSGHLSKVELGVARDAQGQFKAHAWVVCEGATVIGATPDRYTPLTALEARS